MLLIRSVQIIDGTGKPPFRADILIDNDKISAIGNFANKKADFTIDGLGLAATPGFIDVNTDSDHYLSLFTNPLQSDFLLQGVTTIIGGHCGSSLAPLLYGSLKSLRKWADVDQVNVDWVTVFDLINILRRLKLGVNFGTLVGHSTIRRDLIGEEIRDLTEPELEILKTTLSKALKEGALGLSSGLAYAHSRNVPYSEIKSLLAAVTRHHGVYATHLRDERENIILSIKEAVKMAEDFGGAVIISHLRPVIGFEDKFREGLQLIEGGLNERDVYFDVNPFDVSVMPIYTFLPEWAQHGNLETMMEIVSDPTHRSKIIEDFQKSSMAFEKMTIAKAPHNDSIVGKTVKEFTKNRGLDIFKGFLNLMEITNMKALIFYQNINNDLLAETLFHPRALIGSNSASFPESKSISKPERTTNTFPQFLKIAASKNIALEESIKKITAIPAKIFNIRKRGILKEGYYADLVMLNNGKIINVFVNGKVAVQNERITNQRAGTPIS